MSPHCPAGSRTLLMSSWLGEATSNGVTRPQDKPASRARYIQCSELGAIPGKEKQKQTQSALSPTWEQNLLAQRSQGFVTLGPSTSCWANSENRAWLGQK